MNIKTALLIIAVLLLLGVVLFLLLTNARVDRQLILAEADTDQAQEELSRAGEVAEEKRKELAQVQAETQEIIEETEVKIFKLKQETTASKEKISELTTDNQSLKEHIGQLSEPEVELPPQPLPEVLKEGVALFPRRDLSGVEIQVNESGLALFQLMVEEIKSRRELDLNNEQIINENARSNARLAAVIREHKTRYLALSKENTAQGQAMAALETENLQCQDWGRSLQTQVNLYQKKTSLNLVEKVGIVAAIITAFKLGSMMK